MFFLTYYECQRCFDYSCIFLIGIVWLVVGLYIMYENPNNSEYYGAFLGGAAIFLMCGIVNLGILLYQHQETRKHMLLHTEKANTIKMYNV